METDTPHEGAIVLKTEEEKTKEQAKWERRISKTKERGWRRGRETWCMKTRNSDVKGRSARGEESFN